MKRTRRMPSTAPTAVSSSANIGRRRASRSPAWRAVDLDVAAVAVDVLAEQRDLADTFRRQPGDLGDDIGERTTDLRAAYRRHDAERARVVAADLDRDPGVVRGLAARRQGAGKHRLVVEHGFVEDLGDRAADACLVDEIGCAMHVVRAEHDIDVRGLLANEIAILLCQAPGDDDLATLALLLPRLQPAERAVQLVVGVLANAAGVEHHHVGVGLVGDRDVVVVFEQAGDSLGVVLVHLTPKGVDDVAAGHGPKAIGAVSVDSRELPRADWHSETDIDHSIVIGSSSAGVNSGASCCPRPASTRTFSETSTMISGLSAKKLLAFSRP